MQGSWPSAIQQETRCAHQKVVTISPRWVRQAGQRLGTTEQQRGSWDLRGPRRTGGLCIRVQAQQTSVARAGCGGHKRNEAGGQIHGQRSQNLEASNAKLTLK